MERFLIWLDGGPLGTVLRSRYYVPGALLLMFVLVSGSAGALILRAQGWRPPFAQSHGRITITGPDVPSDSAQIQAYVLGAVSSPGVYALAPDARVHDLIAASGGATSDADLSRVALAAGLSDGQTVYVPHIGETVPLLLGGKLNLNSADEQQLHAAVGVSLDIARRIVAYRAAHGQFTAVSQLLLVPISRATYDKIKDLVII
jgi:competence protein ComEA